MYERITDGHLDDLAILAPREPAAGRATVTSRLPPSAHAIARALRDPAPGPPAPTASPPVQRAAAPGAGSFLDEILTAPGPVQCDGAPRAAVDVHAAAAHGVAGPAGALPHLDAVQRSFGHHDVRGVRAHVGGAAAEAAAAIGARAYATGDHVAFAGAPDLHLAAHEAAHVVQQRGGVRLAGGVGAAGDDYERHADAVADRVVRGESAEALLDTMAHRGAAGGPAVQRDPPRDGSPPARTDGGSATPGPTGAPAAQPPGGRGTRFDTVWTLDYHNRYRGSGHASASRTPSTALLVDGLFIMPAEGDTTGHRFAGLHLRDGGAVELGHFRHPAQQGGLASAHVRYVSERVLALRVGGVGRVEGAAIARQIRAGLQDVFVTGDVSAQASAVLTDEQRGRGVTVSAQLPPASEHAHETDHVPYPVADHDGQQYNVLVDIPTTPRDHTTHGEHTREVQSAAQQGHEQARGAQASQAITDTQRQQVTQQLESAYLQRVNQIAADMTQHVVSHTAGSTYSFQTGGQTQLGLSAALNGTIDTTSIIGRLPLGLGSVIARFLPEIALTVTPSLQVQINGQWQHGTSTTDEDRRVNEHREEVQRAVEQTLRQLWSQQVERTRSLVTTLTTTQGTTDRAGAEQRTRDVEQTGYSDTVHLPVAAGRPILRITSGARGG